jgi:GNAT superfamily N-acetyltransferase
LHDRDVRVLVVDPQTTRELRRSVLRPLAGPDDPLPGDDRTDAVHFAALAMADADDVTVRSTCFVFPDPWPPAPNEPAWHLRQMATDPEHRGQGAGAAVMRAVIAYVAREGGGILWCHAREAAFGFYERHGFRPDGDVHPSGEPAIAHQYMWRTVAGGAATQASGSLPP